MKYIYILSQRYSGSTLLSYLLGSHLEVSTIGERRKFYINSIADGGRKLRCSCGQPFQDCPHWNKIKGGILQSIGDADLLYNPTEFQLFHNKTLNHLAYEYLLFIHSYGLPKWLIPFYGRVHRQCEFNLKLINEILKVDGNSTFLDSSKSVQHLLFLSLIEQLDIHVIWLSRDPRAQVCSAIKYNDWTIERAAINWKKEMMAFSKMIKTLNLSYTKLTYEALCENPEIELKKIFDAVELDPKAYSLDFRAQEQHIMGNWKMRLGEDRKIQVREEWKEQLDKRQMEIIENLTHILTEF